MEIPLISVIIPTYDRPHFLSRAIDSVLNQTFKNIEIIVVDDNGMNSQNQLLTYDVMKKYLNDERVKYIVHDVNKNGAAARNTGVKFSSGEYIMFLDDDDIFLPRKIEAQYLLLSQLDETWGACYTRIIYMAGNIVKQISRNEKEGQLLVDALGRNLFIAAGSNLMIRRNVYLRVGGFDESFVRNQDLEFLTKIMVHYKLAFVNEKLLIVNSHPLAKPVDYESVTLKYVNLFKEQINMLDNDSKNMVFQLLNLQMFRYYLQKRCINKALYMIYKSHVNPIEALIYIVHLFNRKIFKYSSGYKPVFRGKFVLGVKQ